MANPVRPGPAVPVYSSLLAPGTQVSHLGDSASEVDAAPAVVPNPRKRKTAEAGVGSGAGEPETEAAVQAAKRNRATEKDAPAEDASAVATSDTAVTPIAGVSTNATDPVSAAAIVASWSSQPYVMGGTSSDGQQLVTYPYGMHGTAYSGGTFGVSSYGAINTKASKGRSPFTPAMETALHQGVMKYGLGNWAPILKDPVLGPILVGCDSRSLGKKWTRMQKKLPSNNPNAMGQLTYCADNCKKTNDTSQSLEKVQCAGCLGWQHTECVNYSWEVSGTTTYYCQRCSACEICQSRKRPREMALCDTKGCVRTYHITCMDPRYRPAESGEEWHCPFCIDQGFAKPSDKFLKESQTAGIPLDAEDEGKLISKEKPPINPAPTLRRESRTVQPRGSKKQRRASGAGGSGAGVTPGRGRPRSIKKSRDDDMGSGSGSGLRPPGVRARQQVAPVPARPAVPKLDFDKMLSQFRETQAVALGAGAGPGGVGALAGSGAEAVDGKAGVAVAADPLAALRPVPELPAGVLDEGVEAAFKPEALADPAQQEQARTLVARAAALKKALADHRTQMLAYVQECRGLLQKQAGDSARAAEDARAQFTAVVERCRSLESHNSELDDLVNDWETWYREDRKKDDYDEDDDDEDMGDS